MTVMRHVHDFYRGEWDMHARSRMRVDEVFMESRLRAEVEELVSGPLGLALNEGYVEDAIEHLPWGELRREGKSGANVWG